MKNIAPYNYYFFQELKNNLKGSSLTPKNRCVIKVTLINLITDGMNSLKQIETSLMNKDYFIIDLFKIRPIFKLNITFAPK